MLDRIDVENDPINFVDPEGLNSVNIAVVRLIAQGDFATAAALAGGTLGPKIAQLPNAIASAINRYPLASDKCDKAARAIYNAFKGVGANPQYLKISADKFPRVAIGNNYYPANHYVVKVGDRIYDAYTGAKGMSYNAYTKMLNSANEGTTYVISKISKLP